MTDNDQTQRQSQTQALNLTLNLGRNTSDPNFEEQVFNEMYSAGSQIGRMAALLEALLSAYGNNAALQFPDARAAIEAFKYMQADIQKAKAERSPERAFVRQLNALRARDRGAYDRTLVALRASLQSESGVADSGNVQRIT